MIERGGTVAVVGLGVMGGSVVKALGRRAPEVRVIGIDPDERSAEHAARDGVRLVRDLAECDLDGAVVVFAAPLDVTVSLVRDTATVWGRAALATDVASLKVPVLAAAETSPGNAAGGVFVGAHPMCGSERSGYAAASADLFEGADVWLCTVRDRSDPQSPALDHARAFWTMLGGQPRAISAERHDRVMTWASHLPQLVASALGAALDEAGIERGVLGPGGRDMTRLAGSSPAMWTPLLEAAASEDAGALRAVERHIAEIRRMLEKGDLSGLEDMMKRGRRWTAAKA